MSILNGVVAMDSDSPGYGEPSTPLKDPTSSPAVHIQWQNSQSACAAMEELRVASSVPRRREFTFFRHPNPFILIRVPIYIQHQNLSPSISSSLHRQNHLRTPPTRSSHPGHACGLPDCALLKTSRVTPQTASSPPPWQTRPSFSTCSDAPRRAWTRTPGSG